MTHQLPVHSCRNGDRRSASRQPRTGNLMLAFLACGAVGCSEPHGAPAVKDTPAQTSEPPAFALPQPTVVMAADPPPPLSYWAPEGATIRNHPHVPEIWLAEVGGRSVKTHFGDQCGASRYQHLVGKPWVDTPAMPPASEIRKFCTTCPHTDDLRSGRINIAINEATNLVAEISCF